ncbi:MAG: hypothetical protein J5952_02200 [Prevotella sp.]|nr:hypothetical protein [Prevotella sp.]
MKKMKRFAYVGAIALLSLLGFSACSSSDDATTDGGLTPQATGEAVKTQFSVSLPIDASKMRMAAGTVQEGATSDLAKFRGMSDIVLIPYMSATDRTTRLGANITLAASTMVKPNVNNTANSIPDGKLLANSTAVLYNDVTIPVGTSGFLFYGKATGEDGFANGYLTATGLTGESSTFKFSLKQIQASPDMAKGENLAAYVTSIAQAKDATDAAITWAGCADNTNSGQSWYNEALGNLYKNFITLKAGGSSYVQAAVQDLYTSVKNNTDAVSNAIKTAITKDTYVSAVSAEGVLTFTDAISGYPQNNNSMPEGAAALTWSGTGNTATAAAVNSSTTATQNLLDMSKIVYPASLYYYVSSGLKSSTDSQLAAYDGTNNWEQILANYTTGTKVTSTSRSVAITNPIQYAVGRLDVNVKALTETGGYYDRKGEKVTIPSGGFKLTGVLIGGQKTVDYQFQPIEGETEYTIYDNVMNTVDAAKQYVKADQNAGPNYTLALETKANTKVYVALEFLNEGKDFQGFDGVVKKGCKFYMVAQLDPTTESTGSVTGVANTGNKVFAQDFNTIANFTFKKCSQLTAGTDADNDGFIDNPEGFASAYTTIPDLRTPELELGFSVDLSWQPGITYNLSF